jgi:hypothetical protein
MLIAFITCYPVGLFASLVLALCGATRASETVRCAAIVASVCMFAVGIVSAAVARSQVAPRGVRNNHTLIKSAERLATKQPRKKPT